MSPRLDLLAVRLDDPTLPRRLAERVYHRTGGRLMPEPAIRDLLAALRDELHI